MKNSLYKTLIHNAPFAYAYLGALHPDNDAVTDYTFLEINHSFETLVNLSKEKILGKNLSLVFPQFFNEHFSRLLPISFEGGDETFEFYSLVLNRYFKIQVYSPEKFFLYFIFMDITEEKLTDAALIKSKQNYQLLLESAHEGIFVVQDDKFVFANPKIEEITGHTLEELLVMDVFSLIDTDNLDFQSYPDVQETEYVKPYQFSIKTKNKMIKWLEISATDFEWNDRHATLCFLTDITKKKEAEDALRASENRKKQIIKSMDDILIILDFNFIFKEFYTPNLKKLYFKPEDFLGKSFEKTPFPKPAYDIIYSTLKKIRITEKTETIEYYLQIGQKTSWFSAAFTIVNQGKSEKEILVVIRDISKLKESEKEVYLERNLFSEGPVITLVWKYSENWPILRVSSNVQTILGYTPESLTDKSFSYSSIIAPEDVERIDDEVYKNIKNKVDSFEQSYRLRDTKGHYHWFYDFTKIIRDELGNIAEIRGYIFDQSHIKDVEVQLQKERVRLQNIITGTNTGTWEWNIQTGETTFNERWADIIGYTIEELEPITIDTWTKNSHPEDLKKSMDIINKHFYGNLPYYECEVRMKHKNGSWVWVLDRGKVLSFTPEGKPLLMFGTHMDITERKLAEEKIIELSIKDPLTNVYNRRYIFDRLNELKAKYSRHKEDFSIVILDIDHFKAVNDAYGHLAGDFILQEFTQIIGKNIRPFDLLGRYGGEEFIIIMSNCKKKIAANRVEHILKIIRNAKFLYENKSISFTFSAGISDSDDYNFNEVILDKFIDCADKRLYYAKETGRNKIIIRD